MDRVRQWMARRVFSPLQGVTFGAWRRILRARGLEPERPYRLRAATTNLLAIVNSVQAARERRRFSGAISRAVPPAPVFVLGHYRSGTTLLHNLLAQDPRLTFPGYFQCTFPRTFLTTQRAGTRMFSGLSPTTRPHDDVEIGLRTPAEDELALCSATFLSPHMGWHFPRRSRRFDRYLTFEGASVADRRAFRDALERFVRKLAVTSPARPAVLKSPCHTGRIDLLLQTFPCARFVHVHRHPLQVFRSTLHMERKVRPMFRYQDGDDDDREAFVLRRYLLLGEAYLRHRRRIPSGRLVEVSFDRLTTKPVATLETIYRGLDLPPFDRDASARVHRYLGSIAGYRRNRHPELDAATRGRVAGAWRRFFDEWRYPVEERRARSA